MSNERPARAKVMIFMVEQSEVVLQQIDGKEQKVKSELLFVVCEAGKSS